MRGQYQGPRRSTKRWLEGAPEYVIAVYDDPRYVDRYTVVFGGSFWDKSMGRNVAYLALSENPCGPHGVSQWGEMPSFCRPAKKIRWLDLPDGVRKHVIWRAFLEGEADE